MPKLKGLFDEDGNFVDIKFLESKAKVDLTRSYSGGACYLNRKFIKAMEKADPL